jgi:hypothetical protein
MQPSIRQRLTIDAIEVAVIAGNRLRGGGGGTVWPHGDEKIFAGKTAAPDAASRGRGCAQIETYLLCGHIVSPSLDRVGRQAIANFTCVKNKK